MLHLFNKIPSSFFTPSLIVFNFIGVIINLLGLREFKKNEMIYINS